MGKYKILVVDDEESLCEILKFNLELEGYEVDVAYSAEQALAMHPERYSLLLLDVMMGEISGFKMARMLKSSPETAAVPIIFCTAKDTEDDTVAGLNLGADDYISKPFEMLELLARVEAVLRRTLKSRASFELDEMKIDFDSRQIFLRGCPVDCTPKEYALLETLVNNRNIALSRERLLELVWGYDFEGDTRTVDVHIQKLRRKLELEGRIKTVYKLGYRLEASP